MKQKLALFILPLLATGAFLLVGTPKAYAATPPDSCFNFNSVDGAIEDYYDNENDDSGQPACTREVDIPASIDGTPVVAIGMEAFYAIALTSVTIPNSVTEIGNHAFYGNNLTTLTIPNSVTEIGEGAFSDNNLTTLTIPSSITEIGGYAFSDNNLTTITIPSSVTEIGEAAFSGNHLASVVIPGSVTSLDTAVFIGQTIPGGYFSPGCRGSLRFWRPSTHRYNCSSLL